MMQSFVAPKLEICCGDVESVLAAKKGGADRVEVCAALEVGGVTPSFGGVVSACRIFPEGANILIRPRKGDFVYTDAELAQMIADITMARASGAAGVVVGALTPEGDVDTRALSYFKEAAQDIEITFHRAFDVCASPEKALEQIIEAGYTRILTSGLAPNALAGVEMLRKLHGQAVGRIQIMAGGGVTPLNVAKIAWLSQADAIHASAKCTKESSMIFRRHDVSMGASANDEYSWHTTSSKTVAELKCLLQSSN